MARSPNQPNENELLKEQPFGEAKIQSCMPPITHSLVRTFNSLPNSITPSLNHSYFHSTITLKQNEIKQNSNLYKKTTDKKGRRQRRKPLILFATGRRCVQFYKSQQARNQADKFLEDTDDANLGNCPTDL